MLTGQFQRREQKRFYRRTVDSHTLTEHTLPSWNQLAFDANTIDVNVHVDVD